MRPFLSASLERRREETARGAEKERRRRILEIEGNIYYRRRRPRRWIWISEGTGVYCTTLLRPHPMDWP